jgi:hypothetical protein
VKVIRLLIPMVLLAVAVPAFGLCGYCDFLSNCQAQRGLNSRCHYNPNPNCTVDCIEDYSAFCRTWEPETFGNSYSITSVIVEDASATATPIKQKAAVTATAKKKSGKSV